MNDAAIVRFAATALLGILATAAVADIDLGTGEGTVKAMRKLHCSLADNKPVTYAWSGRAYSRVPGEPDRLLFRLSGMNVRQCVTVSDPQRGEGYRLVSREIMLYLDPQTGEILRTWENPWTDETVDVIHVANDPVNQRPQFPLGPDGKPTPFRGRIQGDTVFMAFEVPLFYTNPLAGEFQEYVGGTYHATEIFDFVLSRKDLVSEQRDSADVNVAWVRIAQWLPWMKMGSRAGLMYVNATGIKLDSWDDLPEQMKAEIRARYPDYTAPPPGDDSRPNETSWTVFKKALEAGRDSGAKAGPTH